MKRVEKIEVMRTYCDYCHEMCSNAYVTLKRGETEIHGCNEIDDETGKRHWEILRDAPEISATPND